MCLAPLRARFLPSTFHHNDLTFPKYINPFISDCHWISCHISTSLESTPIILWISSLTSTSIESIHYIINVNRKPGSIHPLLSACLASISDFYWYAYILCKRMHITTPMTLLALKCSSSSRITSKKPHSLTSGLCTQYWFVACKPSNSCELKLLVPSFSICTANSIIFRVPYSSHAYHIMYTKHQYDASPETY